MGARISEGSTRQGSASGHDHPVVWQQKDPDAA